MRASRIAMPALLAGAALGATTLPSAAATHAQGFPWPVKPFWQPHPIRGNFGDPRTEFYGAPSRTGIMSSGGRFSFHSGIDIVARTGRAVYPVRSGTVRLVSGTEVAVDSPGGSTFVYWHIRPAVANGTQAVAQQTVLGRVLEHAGNHVHFGEFENGAFVNPLAAGHLRPYTDRLTPRVRQITVRQAATGAILDPVWVHGRIKISADAFDLPSVPVPGAWAGFPVAPALVNWRLQRKGRVAVSETVAADFRGALPPRTDFWSVYARGTYQNMTMFGTHLAYLQPGRYVYNLTPEPLDTRRLRYGNDVYDIVVTAVDIRGNASSLTQRITVHNVARKHVRARS